MCTHRDRHVLTHSFPTRRPSGLLAGWPVLLVVDAEGAGQSVGAVAHGLATFPGAPPVAGVIVNRVASDRHAAMIAEGFGVLDLPLCGMIRRDPALAVASRHLGLVQAREDGALVARLDAVAALLQRKRDGIGKRVLVRVDPGGAR